MALSRSMHRYAYGFSVSIAILGIAFTQPIFAQDVPVSASSTAPAQANAQAAPEPKQAKRQQSTPQTLSTIIVTAQKRKQALQDVPISIAVVRGDTLNDLQFNRSTDLQYLVPGLVSPEQSGPRNFGFFIRGIGTSTFSAETLEPSVAYVVDGVVMGQGGAALTDLPDISQIEVLRGPQSTLFGKNASAGVINITTLAPSTDYYIFRAGISDASPDNDRHAYAYVSGPINSTLAFSLSARRSVRDGYIDNVPDGRTFNNRNESGFRGKLQWQPSDKLTATLIADYWQSNTHCCIWTIERFGGPDAATNPLQAPFFFEDPAIALLGTLDPGRDNQKQTIDGDVFAHVKNDGASLQVDYDLGGGYTLTSISAWRGFKTMDGLDSDSSPVDFLDTNFADLHQHQISQELRIQSPTGGFADYVAGLYYFRQDVHDSVLQLFPFIPGIFVPFLNKQQFNDVTTKNVAGFGQVNFHPTDKLVLTAGARWLRETQSVDKTITDPTIADTMAFTGNLADTYLTSRLAAEYHFTPNIMAFTSVTRGYKGGGFDLYGEEPGLKLIGPEKPTAYEAGLRTNFPDTGITVNLTGYYEKINGYQTSSRDPVTLLFPITNGNAKTKGFELQGSWRPVGQNDFDVNFGLAYTHAVWGPFPNAPCAGAQTAAQGCVNGVQDLTGQVLPFAPKWSFNIGPDYSHPIGGNLKISATGNLNYRSRQIIGFPNSPEAQEPGYALLDASIGIGAIDDKWKVSLFGKNLTDKHYRTFQFNTASNGTSAEYRVYDSRRIVGVALDVDL